MDLGSIQKKLEKGKYQAIKDFHSDVNLTFDNAMTYNESGSVVNDMAKELREKFEDDHKKIVQREWPRKWEALFAARTGADRVIIT